MTVRHSSGSGWANTLEFRISKSHVIVSAGSQMVRFSYLAMDPMDTSDVIGIFLIGSNDLRTTLDG